MRFGCGTSFAGIGETLRRQLRVSLKDRLVLFVERRRGRMQKLFGCGPTWQTRSRPATIVAMSAEPLRQSEIISPKSSIELSMSMSV
jgi:hypothetical protein